MRILYLASSADWHVDVWTRYFTSNNDLFLFSDDQEYLDDEEYNNVEVLKSNGYFGKFLNSINSKSHKLFQLNKLCSVKVFAAEVKKLIHENDIDIIHAHSLYFGYLASFIPSCVPVIFTPMGSDIILQAQTNSLYRHMARRAFNRADVVTNDSILLQKKGYLLGAKSDENYIIQNGVDKSIFFPCESEIKSHLRIGKNELLIFSPRAITPNYNIDIIIEALAMVRDMGINVKCMFSYAFGDEYFFNLKRLVRKLNLEDNVIWLGRLSYSEMADHYNAADLILSVPSSDSSPKSVYEAMFCRKPIVVSDIDWTNEILSKSDCMRVEPKNANQIAQAVLKIFSDPCFAQKLANSGYQTASQNFCYYQNMSEMEAIMLRACTNP